MPQSQFDFEVELHRICREARSQRNSYFEKLAILDGGTVALVITAILGPLHGTIKHKYLLGIGLTFLIGAMLTLLWRNYLAAKFELRAAADVANYPMGFGTAGREEQSLKKQIYYTGSTGALLSAVGIVLLLGEVWLILL